MTTVLWGEAVAHRAGRVVVMAHAGYVVAEAAATAVMMSTMMAPIVVMPIVIMAIVMVVVPIGTAVATVPIGIPSPVAVVGIAPIPIPAPVGAPVRTIAPTPIEARVVVPIIGVVAVDVDVGVATAIAARVVVVIIVARRGGLCAETLDAAGEVGIIVGLGGGVNDAVCVGHRLRGLVHGLGIVDVVLAVGIVGLVVVFRVAADARTHIGAVAGGHPTAGVAVRRVIGVVFGRLTVRRAADEGH